MRESTKALLDDLRKLCALHGVDHLKAEDGEIVFCTSNSKVIFHDYLSTKFLLIREEEFTTQYESSVVV